MKPGDGIRFAADGPRWRTPQSSGGGLRDGGPPDDDPMAAGEGLPRILTGSPIGDDDDVVSMPTFWRRLRERRVSEPVAPPVPSRPRPLTFALRRGAMIAAGIAAAVLLLVAFVGGFLLASSFLGVDPRPSLRTADGGAAPDPAVAAPPSVVADGTARPAAWPAGPPVDASAVDGKRAPAAAVLADSAAPDVTARRPEPPMPDQSGTVAPTMADARPAGSGPVVSEAAPSDPAATATAREAPAAAPAEAPQRVAPPPAPVPETSPAPAPPAARPTASAPVERPAAATPARPARAPPPRTTTPAVAALPAPPPKPAPPSAAEPAAAEESAPAPAAPPPAPTVATAPAAPAPDPGPPTQILPRQYQSTFASPEAREPAGEVFRGLPPLRPAPADPADLASAAEPSGPLAAAGVPGIAAGPFAVQLGAFRDPGNARDVMGRLRGHGYAPQIVAPPSAASRMLHIVLLGRIAGRAEADALVARLKGQGFDAFVRDLR